ncbi:transposable element Tcb1 transposase [Trichonephila clavipes]|nr:transposable element Tcb1 transposase [Trichonephila clavipes]
MQITLYTALQKEHLVPTLKHGGGEVIEWGSMASNDVGKLEYIEPIMIKYDYLDVLKNLKDSAPKLDLGSSFRFQDDSDPRHTAEILMLWLLYNVPDQLHTPPQSPDLNPVEHLWGLLERKIHQHNISSKDMLKSALKEEWEKR